MEITVSQAEIILDLINQAFLDGFDDENLQELHEEITNFIESE